MEGPLTKVTQNWNKNILFYFILLIIVIVGQTVFILHLIKTNNQLVSDHHVRKCELKNHPIEKRSVPVRFTRVCPPGCRKILKLSTQVRSNSLHEQAIHPYSYFNQNTTRSTTSSENSENLGSRGYPIVPNRQGLDGIQGTVGRRVQLGESSRQGLDGAQGVIGRQGQLGESGRPGFDGVQGPSGRQGRQGLDGAEGPPGRQGQAGESGRQGLEGPEGPIGRQGQLGESGRQGFDGATGPRGQPGQSGARGLAGSPGREGPVGLPGRPGLPGPGYVESEEGLRRRQFNSIESADEAVTGVRTRGDQGQPIDFDDSPSKLETKEYKVTEALQTLKLHNNPNCVDDFNHHKVADRLKEKGSVTFMILVDLTKSVFCILHA